MSQSPEPTQAELVVIGAGPGGYPAAFHAADIGMKVTLIDKAAAPGGVCLYRGCIPSKAFLHAAAIIRDAREAEAIGITFGEPTLDLDKVRNWKQGIVDKLTGGLGALCKARDIRYINGTAQFTGPTSLSVEKVDGTTEHMAFEHAILATGSLPAKPGLVPDSPRVLDSTTALDMTEIPKRLLVMGGGYIGLELGQVYATFGSQVDVVEMQAGLLPGVDPDLVAPLAEYLTDLFNSIMLSTRVMAITDTGTAIDVRLNRPDGTDITETYDQVLVAVGRRPVTHGLGLEAAGVNVDPMGFVTVDAQRRTNVATISAIGDIAGQPMLAHKATHEGRSAVESIHDGTHGYAPQAIPAVVFTEPEIAWTGLTEDEARRKGLQIKVGSFPWMASGRAATLDRSGGLTKMVCDAATQRVLGVGITGTHAGELIGEAVLAIEMGAVAEDIALSIHAHPSLSETLMEAAEAITGGSTHFFQRM
jgi:dihydrolipoamide dehydrogenase